MENDIPDIISRYNENHLEFKKKCFIISQDIKEGRLNIDNFIATLQNLLVNYSPNKRALGVATFTEVLRNLPLDFLNDQELRFISLFYLERLSDHHQVLPELLKGLLAITQFKNFPKDVSQSILNALFLNVACQQQQQADRYTIYNIFQVLLEKCQVEVLSMGIDYIYGIISSIDGERDPRNLLFLFEWLQKFLIAVSLGHLVEEMFEVMACYFPIDFRAPPSKSNEVSRETLADALCPCLCAIPEFSEYCIPLALEKLDSSLIIAKMDALNLLEEGCKRFDESAYVIHGSNIWSQLQKEVFSEMDDKVKLKCLRTLCIVMKKISKTTNGYFKNVLKDISTTIKGNLLPDSKLFRPSIDILLHVALSSLEAASFIVKEIVPLLTNTFKITITPENKAVIIKTLTEFVKVYQSQCDIKNLAEMDELEIVPILDLKVLSESNNSLIIAGFESLSDLAENLPLNIRVTLYKILEEIIIVPQEENIKLSVLQCIKRLSQIYPNEIQAHVFNRNKINDPSTLELYLNAFSVIADVNYFKNIFTELIIAYATDSIITSTIALNIIKALFESAGDDCSLFKLFLDKGIIPKLVEYVTLNREIHTNTNYELLQQASSVIKIIIGAQNIKVQNDIISYQLKIIANYSSDETVYIFLLDGFLSRLRSVLSFDHYNIELLVKVALSHENEITRDVATQLLANLFNKLANEDELNRYLTIIKDEYLQNSSYSKCNKLSPLLWITKALIMRNHFQGNIWTKWLMDLFEEDIEIAKGFKIIMHDDYESLSSKSFCNKTLLYRQKFFIFVTNKLSSKCDFKESYMYAIGYLLASAPEQAILLQFGKIQKLLVLCLELCKDVDILLIILNKMTEFLKNNEPIFQESLEDFILRVLNLTTFEFSMGVRIAALQCLAGFATSVPVFRVLPFKQQILYHLGCCIDDKKRLVRKEAMEARSAWYLIDAPI